MAPEKGMKLGWFDSGDSARICRGNPVQRAIGTEHAVQGAPLVVDVAYMKLQLLGGSPVVTST